MTSSPNRNVAITSNPHRGADGAFLRRILFGLIAATFICGAVTVALTSQADFVSERFDIASTQGPA